MDPVSLSQTIAVALSKTEFTAQQSIVQLAQQLVARSQSEQPDTTCFARIRKKENCSASRPGQLIR